MSDWRDVMNARNEADAARSILDPSGGAVVAGDSGDVAVAVLLSATAVCAELRALGTAVTYAASELAEAFRLGR